MPQKLNFKLKNILICIIFFYSISFSQGLIEIPKVNQPVNDFANVLSNDEVEYLNQKVKTFEDSTSIQIGIAIYQSLNGEEDADFSQRFVKINPFGNKEKNSGILILVSISERKIRIETGYGMEGIIPDALTNQIIRQIINPEFKSQKYFAGLNSGVDYLIKASKGEYKNDKKKSSKNSNFYLILLIIMFFIFPMFSTSRYQIGSHGVRRRHFGGPFIGGFGGGGFGGGGSSWSSGGGGFGGGGSSGSW